MGLCLPEVKASGDREQRLMLRPGGLDRHETECSSQSLVDRVPPIWIFLFVTAPQLSLAEPDRGRCRQSSLDLGLNLGFLLGQGLTGSTRPKMAIAGEPHASRS